MPRPSVAAETGLPRREVYARALALERPGPKQGMTKDLRRGAWQRGRRAETLAAWWLRLKGYRILARGIPGRRRGD